MRSVWVGAVSALWIVATISGCSEHPQSPSGSQPEKSLAQVIEIQNRHSDSLMSIAGVVGTATGLESDGRFTIHVLTEKPGVAGIPSSFEGVPVIVVVTGPITALQGPTFADLRADVRPVPNGASVGNINDVHFDAKGNLICFVGTLGAVVFNATSTLLLSNNHVLARGNAAQIGEFGEAIVQPGLGDNDNGACHVDPTDQVATLADFERIDFAIGHKNVMDAAVAVMNTSATCATPPGFYGRPSTEDVLASGLRAGSSG